MEYLNTTNIIFLITILTVGINIYFSLRNPQEKSETTDAVFDERMKNYEKTTEKALELALNHSHTVEMKLDKHISESQDVAIRGAEKMGSIEAKLDMLIKK